MSLQQPAADGEFNLTTTAFHILLALCDGERHGYAIMQAVARDTEGRVRLGPGTLYRTIREMLQARLIVESDERPDPALDDERRRYYRLTAAGKHVARAEVERLQQLIALAQAKPLLQEPLAEAQDGQANPTEDGDMVSEGVLLAATRLPRRVLPGLRHPNGTAI